MKESALTMCWNTRCNILDGPPNGPPDVSVEEERDDAGPTNGTNISRGLKVSSILLCVSDSRIGFEPTYCAGLTKLGGRLSLPEQGTESKH
jgi:hypothetical protein